MYHSKAYVAFLEEMTAIGTQKLKGYNSYILHEIYEEERVEVEELIWNAFQGGDCDMAKFLPQLKNYNGVEALKNKIKECNVPSDNSLELAVTLYNSTKEMQYLQILKENIELGNESQRLSSLAKMLKCTPDISLCEIFKTTYIHDNNSSVRSAAANGILYCKGLIKDPYDIKEMMNNMGILKRMNEDDAEKRIQIVQEIETEYSE